MLIVKTFYPHAYLVQIVSTTGRSADTKLNHRFDFHRLVMQIDREAYRLDTTLGSPILIVVSVICRDQCIYYLYYALVLRNCILMY